MSGDCAGCYNGCANVISDKCVKYTGANVSQLDITTNTPLSEVEEKILNYLISVMSGTGIEPIIDSQYMCSLFSQYLPEGGEVNLVNILIASTRSLCDLQSQLNTVKGQLTTLEGNYTLGVGCLSGVTVSSGTHAILQATITRLCALISTVTSIQSALGGYVKSADLNLLIQAYLDTLDTDKIYSKMTPYVAVEYYGALSGYPTIADGFALDGAGYGAWEKVYLCNGENGTPDKKGRIPIGCTSMGGSFNAEIDPLTPGNPTYTNPQKVEGSNMVTLGIANMPSHNHTAVSTVTDPGHRHLFIADNRQALTLNEYTRQSTAKGNLNVNQENDLDSGNFYTKSINREDTQASQTTGVAVSTAISDKGGGLAHSNIPPVMSCYYIMYIPS